MLKADNAMLTAQVSELIKIVAALKEDVSLLRNGKNSGTSSTPPRIKLGGQIPKTSELKQTGNQADNQVMKDKGMQRMKR